MLQPIERYGFEVQGWFVRRGALDAGLVHALNQALARHEGLGPASLPRTCIPSWTPVVNEYRLLGLLDLDPVFQTLIDHPAVLDVAEALVPRPCRLGETYSITRLDGIGLPLHAQPEARPSGRPGEALTHLLKVGLALTDVGPDDGPMVILEGSHRLDSEFPFDRLHPKWELPDCDRSIREAFVAANAERLSIPWEEIPGYREIHVRAGDVVFFCEGAWHGAKAPRSGRRRRTLYYGYVPYHYANWHGIPHSEELLQSATPARRRLLAGPFVGTRYACHDTSALPDDLPFPRLPNSERGAERFVVEDGARPDFECPESPVIRALGRLLVPSPHEDDAPPRGRARFIVEGDGGGVFGIDTNDGRIWMAEPGTVDCTIAASCADLLALADGEEDAVRLFYAGRLRVQGDVRLAMRLVDRW